MNKSQAITNFSHYIGFRIQAKKELDEIKQIVNPQEQQEKVNISFEKHSRNFQNAQKILNSHNLSGEVNRNYFWEYGSIVNELKDIKDKFEKENRNNENKNPHEYACGQCKQRITGKYWYNETERKKGGLKPISKVKGFYSKFCSQECINLWRLNNIKKHDSTNASEIMCHECNKFFQGQYWHKNNPRESSTHKFCSQGCCNVYWNKKKCASDNCSNLLTSEEICYCSSCLVQQEKIWKNLEKGSQKIKDKKGEFQKELDDYVSNKKSGNFDVERESEREQNQNKQQQLRTAINNLESNLSKTPQQEQELTQKKQELAELEKKLKELTEKGKKNNSQPSKNNHLGLKIGLVSLAGVVLIGLVVILIKKHKNRNK